MLRSARHISGLIAFLALTASFAESAWASTCAMPTHNTAAGGGEAVGDKPADMPCAGHGEHAEDHRHDESCPFDSPAAAQACAGAASLGSADAALPAAATVGVSAVFAFETRVGFLLGVSVFRPPRA